MKYFIYARKSSESDEKQTQSIDDQVRTMSSIATKAGLTVIDTLSESKSAKIPGMRPEFDSLTSRIQSGKAHCILSWKLDRLARNPDEAGKILGMLQRGEIQHIKTSEKDYYPGDNALISYLEFGMADQYSRDLSVNVKRGLKSKLEKGWRPCSAPSGYLNTKTEARGENYIVKDPERFSLLRKAWDLMLTGYYTVDQILSKLNNDWGFRTRKGKKRGGKPMSRSSLYRMFTNQFYAGMMEYQLGGKNNQKQEDYLVLPGKHDPMVSLEEFDRVQMLLGRNGRPRPNKQHEYAFTGMMKCGECDSFISATSKQKLLRSTGQLKPYTLYYCVCARKWKDKCSQRHYTNLNEIENQIMEIISHFTILPQFKNWALNALNKQDDKEFEEHNKIIEAHQKALSSAERQLSNLTQMRMREQLDDEEYDRERTRLKNEITILKTKEEQMDMQTESWINLTKKAFEFACNASDAFTNGDAEIKRTILSAISLNCVLKYHKLSIEAPEWLIPFTKLREQVAAPIEALELTEKLCVERQNDVFTSSRPLVRGRWDLNPRSSP